MLKTILDLIANPVLAGVLVVILLVFVFIITTLILIKDSPPSKKIDPQDKKKAPSKDGASKSNVKKT